MRFVLDASVAIAAARPTELHHRASRARVARVLGADDEILVPALFGFEVGAALVRRGEIAARVKAYVEALTAGARTVTTIGPRSARRILDVAAATRLRGADAS